MSVGKRHLHVNGPMVTKVWSSGKRRAKLTRLDRQEGKEKKAARRKKRPRAAEKEKERDRRSVLVRTFVCR